MAVVRTKLIKYSETGYCVVYVYKILNKRCNSLNDIICNQFMIIINGIIEGKQRCLWWSLHLVLLSVSELG